MELERADFVCLHCGEYAGSDISATDYPHDWIQVLKCSACGKLMGIGRPGDPFDGVECLYCEQCAIKRVDEARQRR